MDDKIKTIVLEDDGSERIEEISTMHLEKIKFGNDSELPKRKRKAVHKKKD